MRFGSVCSGIEAASVAWHPLGWQAAWLAEIEPFPSAVLKHHYPEVPNLGDMTTLPDRIRGGDVPRGEVVAHGAGRDAGLRSAPESLGCRADHGFGSCHQMFLLDRCRDGWTRAEVQQRCLDRR